MRVDGVVCAVILMSSGVAAADVRPHAEAGFWFGSVRLPNSVGNPEAMDLRMLRLAVGVAFEEPLTNATVRIDATTDDNKHEAFLGGELGVEWPTPSGWNLGLRFGVGHGQDYDLVLSGGGRARYHHIWFALEGITAPPGGPPPYDEIAMRALVLGAGASTETSEPDPPGKKPRLSPDRIAGEVLAGVASGLGGAILGGLVGYGLAGAGARVGSYSDTVPILGALIGWYLGSPIGVYAVGSFGEQTGSIVTTYAWSLGCAALIATGNAASVVTHNDKQVIPFVIVGVFGAPVAATIGFNLSRRFRAIPTPNGMAVAGAF